MARYGFQSVTPASGAVISTADAKVHCSIAAAETGHDSYLDNLVSAAVAMFQRETGYQLLTQTDDYTIDKFPCNGGRILIPRYPLSSVTSIKYQDTDDAEQPLASSKYIVSEERTPPEITLDAAEADWPSTAEEAESVKIRIVTGYGAAADVPEDIITCLLLIVSHWFENRETAAEKRLIEIPLGAKAIMDSLAVGDAFLEYGA